MAINIRILLRVLAQDKIKWKNQRSIIQQNKFCVAFFKKKSLTVLCTYQPLRTPLSAMRRRPLSVIIIITTDYGHRTIQIFCIKITVAGHLRQRTCKPRSKEILYPLTDLQALFFTCESNIVACSIYRNFRTAESLVNIKDSKWSQYFYTWKL